METPRWRLRGGGFPCGGRGERAVGCSLHLRKRLEGVGNAYGRPKENRSVRGAIGRVEAVDPSVHGITGHVGNDDPCVTTEKSAATANASP